MIWASATWEKVMEIVGQYKEDEGRISLEYLAPVDSEADYADYNEPNFLISVAYKGFSGHNHSVYFWKHDLAAFSEQLKELENTRQGTVTLKSMGGDAGDFQLTILSTDKLGHMAVEAKLWRGNYMADGYKPLSVTIAFEIDPETLIEFARDFEVFVRGI